MIIWSGWGFLVAVFIFVASLLTEIVTEHLTGDDDFYQQSPWAMPAALIIAGIAAYAVDFFTDLGKSSGNSLFFIPMKWWAPILFVCALALIAYWSMNGR